MSVSEIKEKTTPIKIEQTELNKFYHGLPKPKGYELVNKIEK